MQRIRNMFPIIVIGCILFMPITTFCVLDYQDHYTHLDTISFNKIFYSTLIIQTFFLMVFIGFYPPIEDFIKEFMFLYNKKRKLKNMFPKQAFISLFNKEGLMDGPITVDGITYYKSSNHYEIEHKEKTYALRFEEIEEHSFSELFRGVAKINNMDEITLQKEQKIKKRKEKEKQLKMQQEEEFQKKTNRV